VSNRKQALFLGLNRKFSQICKSLLSVDKFIVTSLMWNPRSAPPCRKALTLASPSPAVPARGSSSAASLMCLTTSQPWPRGSGRRRDRRGGHLAAAAVHLFPSTGYGPTPPCLSPSTHSRAKNSNHQLAQNSNQKKRGKENTTIHSTSTMQWTEATATRQWTEARFMCNRTKKVQIHTAACNACTVARRVRYIDKYCTRKKTAFMHVSVQ
jgi:hypothetical protein